MSLDYLGNDFYCYNIDNQNKSSLMYVNFKFKSSNFLSKDEAEHIFQEKLNGIKLLFPQFEIHGGNALWVGYIITIKLHTIEELERQKIKYSHKLNLIEDELEILKSLCGI